ncbi:MAG: CBS domain-containing protein [Elusimicrobia bacterium]|jgi:CBS domain-containing protein|nr:CBS domain-containing protein [Elusimicrobiota bacterium]MBK7206871.1 CBS domain-containing protein [Elusimicrobiota bacterium]MBK7545691.1 CBS domain-containing protein [Elusimicrobiota bacterium]MBK7574954.1 CBS domain-containing protein [Elusimicrobiota bacterium]MBK7687778.1 CBS domain-containing protein [Elusimicrobiota bacterium]
MGAPAAQRLKDKRIGEVVNPRLIQAPPDISLKRAIDLMRESKSAYIVVAEGRRVVGMFTESDVARKILGKNIDEKRPVRDFMTPDPIVLRQDDPVGRAVDLMAENDFYHIPLVNEKQELVNVLSVRTLIRFLAEFYPGEIYNIPPNPHQVAPTAEGG